MINETSIRLIGNAAAEEKEAAIAKHGLFNSDHEAYAVLQEEIEELQEIADAYDFKNMALIWRDIREDKEIDHAKLETIYDWARRCAWEAAQVMAMCLKWEEK